MLGRSGAGKSTLIRCINRLVEPDAGEILWGDRPITEVGSSELRAMRGKIGMIFQHFNLLPRLSVLINVMVGSFSGMPLWRCVFSLFTSDQRKAALDALNRVGLKHLAESRVEDLSGGQQQRVAIARILIQNHPLLLGDEPTSNLDPITAERILELIAMLHKEQHMTVVLNLHDITMACKYATRIIGISKGIIVFDGPTTNLGERELQIIYPSEKDE